MTVKGHPTGPARAPEISLPDAGKPAAAPSAARPASLVNVRDCGAVGDGVTCDTAALNAAMRCCAQHGGGVVVVPPGRYLTGTIWLQSNLTLLLEAGAEIVGCSDLDQYHCYTPPGLSPEAARWHRGLLLGVDVSNVVITGRGTIDGNNVTDPLGEEGMRGPHAVVFGNSRNIVIRDVSIKRAANYAVLLELTDDVEIRGINVTGGWDGIHFRGGGLESPCRNITITHCEFYTGDDCIAGAFWRDTLISHCILNSSCNGLRLIGPANGLTLHSCLFFGPGRFEHRTSRQRQRRNMLAGLCLQPGSWCRTEGPLDGVQICDVTMHTLASPLHLAIHAGSSGGRIAIQRLTATGLYGAAASIESWGDAPIEQVTLRDVSLEFAGGGAADATAGPIAAPQCESRPLPVWGLYAHRVNKLQLENVRLSLAHSDGRPAVRAEKVETLLLDMLRTSADSHVPLVLEDVRQVVQADAPRLARG